MSANIGRAIEYAKQMFEEANPNGKTAAFPQVEHMLWSAGLELTALHAREKLKDEALEAAQKAIEPIHKIAMQKHDHQEFTNLPLTGLQIKALVDALALIEQALGKEKE